MKQKSTKTKEILTNHFGCDRSSYFLEGAWITAIATLFGWVGIIVGFILSIALAFVKEIVIDKQFDCHSILATGIGGASTIILYVLIAVLFI